MPVLQVKDCPVAVYERLRLLAEREHRSISQQTIVAVEEHLERHVEDERRATIRRILGRDPIPLPREFPSSAELVREMRDAR